MINAILMIYIGYKIGVPVWFYVVCGALITLDIVGAVIKALKDN